MNGAALLVLQAAAIPVEWQCKSSHSGSDHVPDTCVWRLEELIFHGVPGENLLFPNRILSVLWFSSAVLLSEIRCA